MKRYVTFLTMLAVSLITSLAQVTLTISPSERGAEIGPLHYGIFFEEINHAGDGGLYAELIQNRSFEDSDNSIPGWSTSDGVEATLISNGLMNVVQRHAVSLRVDGTQGNFCNSGFWGMKFRKDLAYKASFWIKTEGSGITGVELNLCNEKGEVIGSETVALNPTAEWQKYEVAITSQGDADKGSFSMQFVGEGEVLLDMISLFPPTFKDRPNGCRPDLAQMLADMKPAFMRFPGGCYIEGEYRAEYPHFNGDGWTDGSTNRFEWKQTIGPLEERPGHWNVNWRYRVSDGLGYHEMLQLAEDLGAEPLYVVNIGMGHGWTQPYDDIDEYIQEALDAMEYANGDIATTYGAMRAANGHPEPFNLRLIEIGNENYQANSWEQSDHYANRYYAFYKAIKEKYPEAICIGNVESWGTDAPTWRNSYPVDAVDEHYYRDPAWFVNNYKKYDKYDRNASPKVYAGEYAVTSNYGTTGNLAAALGEAVYMLGMENNSDLCVMNSYAPIFTHESDFNWKPDMIRFNAAESYGTPSYYVQKLMPNYVGKQNVKWTENGVTETTPNYCGLSTWLTSAKFENYTITKEDGTVYKPNFDGSSNWINDGGSWTEENGALIQDNTSMEGKLYYDQTEELGENYTIEIDATKTGGKEGFLIAFNLQDTKNFLWWNLGGWGNTKHAIEYSVNGTKTTLASAAGSLETGRTYHLKIEVNGLSGKCYADGELIHQFAIEAQRKVYVSSSIDDETKKLYVKLVNPSKTACSTNIRLKGYKVNGGQLIKMVSASDNDENTNDNHYKVVPETTVVNAVGSSFMVDVPAYSFNIYELNVEEGESENGVFIEDGIYYIYNKEKDGYLSRGADWGTKAVFDEFGVPYKVTKTEDEKYTLSSVQYSNADIYLGKDVEPYTDKSDWYPIYWIFEINDDGELVLKNTGAGEYLTAGKTLGDGASFTTDITEAAGLTLMSAKSVQERLKSQYDAIEFKYVGAFATDVTEAVVDGADMSTSLSKWRQDFSKSVGINEGLTELYEGFGKVEQTVTGLKPGGCYRLSVPAFFRAGTRTKMLEAEKVGMEISNAYIFAGSEKKQVMTWAKERKSDRMPDTMADAAVCFGEGRYMNSVIGKADDSGNLVIGIACPQRVSNGWMIWGKVKLEEITEPQDYTSYIVNNSFENGLTGWNTNMQTQTNGEPSAMKDGNVYCEMWTKTPGRLWDVYAKQTIEGLPVGKYRLMANVHAENQDYKNVLATGYYLFAGEEKVEVNSPDTYSVLADVNDGTLEIGVYTQNTSANWVTVDNFRLLYLGVEDNSLVLTLLQEEVQKLRDIAEEKKDFITLALKKEAEKTIAMAETANDNDEIAQVLKNVKAVYKKILEFEVKEKLPLTSYVFAYFPNNSNENLYLAHSMNGFDFTPLNNGNRVMASDTVAVTGGIRDPHILRGEDGKTFYMVATDMVCARGWDSNRGIVMYKSNDLIHWQHATVHFPTRFADTWKNVTRVWAPEVIWNPDYKNPDGTMGRYMVYFSLLTNDGKCRYDKVFYCHANDDFTDLIEEPVFLYDRGSATIDADIIFDKNDNLYHMIYKNEGTGGICHVTAKTLTASDGAKPGSQWGVPSGTIQQTNVAVEGGGLFRLINTNTWVVMYDCYGSGYYQFCTTRDWKNYTFKQNTYTNGAFTPRHGTVLPLTTAEAKALLKAFPTNGYNPELPVVPGDANGDGDVNIADANMVVNSVLGRAEVVDEEAADMDADGTVTRKDAEAIVDSYLDNF